MEQPVAFAMPVQASVDAPPTATESGVAVNVPATGNCNTVDRHGIGGGTARARGRERIGRGVVGGRIDAAVARIAGYGAHAMIDRARGGIHDVRPHQLPAVARDDRIGHRREVADAGRRNVTTRNACALLVPPLVVTLTACAPAVADVPITKVVASVVEFSTCTPAMEMPLPAFTVVAPGTKPVPVSVTATVCPRPPLSGATLASVGGAGVTVNVWLSVVPPAVVTVSACAPSAASVAIVSVPVAVVVLVTLTPLTTIPVPATCTVVAPGTKSDPVSVTVTVVPWAPLAGLTPASAGADGSTVKVGEVAVPLVVVTVTAWSPRSAVDAIVRSAVSSVALGIAKLEAVIPVPSTVTLCTVPVNPVPVTVTCTVEPRIALLGAMLVMVSGSEGPTESVLLEQEERSVAAMRSRPARKSSAVPWVDCHGEPRERRETDPALGLMAGPARPQFEAAHQRRTYCMGIQRVNRRETIGAAGNGVVHSPAANHRPPTVLAAIS